MKRIFRVIPVLLCALSMTACAAYGTMAGSGSENVSEDTEENTQQEPAKTEFFGMDTYMTFTVYGEGAQQALSQAEEGMMKDLY